MNDLGLQPCHFNSSIFLGQYILQITMDKSYFFISISQYNISSEFYFLLLRVIIIPLIQNLIFQLKFFPEFDISKVDFFKSISAVCIRSRWIVVHREEKFKKITQISFEITNFLWKFVFILFICSLWRDSKLKEKRNVHCSNNVLIFRFQ